MGKPMARNLLKRGFPLVVHNRSRAAVEELVSAGAKAAQSPAEVARQSTRIITMLPDGPDVQRVLTGADGVFSALQRGTILIDMSTIAPETARKAGAAAPPVSTKNESMGAARHGFIRLDRADMPRVAEHVGTFGADKLGVDETGLAGFYDISLKWPNGDAEALAAALGAYGLELRHETRKVRILHAKLERAAPAKP